MAEGAPLQPRAYNRAEPITRWRHDLAHLSDRVAEMIYQHEDPERQLCTATETAQDIVHVVKLTLRKKYGKVFDPIFDGPPR